MFGNHMRLFKWYNSLNRHNKKDFDVTMALHPTISEEFVTMYG